MIVTYGYKSHAEAHFRQPAYTVPHGHHYRSRQCATHDS
jgi:hypothetical protein